MIARYLFSIIVMLPFLMALAPGAHAQERAHFELRQGSSLQLKGTSNINQFSCRCNKYSRRGDFSFHENNRGGWLLEDARLRIEVAAIDCGHSGINRDLNKALKSDQHPQIIIDFQEIVAHPELGSDLREKPQSVDVVVDITLALQTRQVPLSVKVSRSKAGYLTATAEKALFMSDFGVTPPTALFGLVKVNDRINISFSLELALQ